MENHNCNNSKNLHERTDIVDPSISRTCCRDRDDERTLLENNYDDVLVDVQTVSNCVTPELDSNSNQTESDREEEENKKRPFTRKQKLIFVCFAMVAVADCMLYSVLAPFYPIEAQMKGVSTSVSGLVFGVYALVSFIASPIIGKYVARLGPKFLFFSGTFLGAGCNILFGVLDEIEDTNTFVAFCFVLRSFESLGAAASITASMTMIASVFPHNVAQMTGIFETFSGIGLMIGPALGGALYKIGGYKLPFLVLGGIDLLVLAVTMFVIPDLSPSEEESKPGSLTNFMMIPVVWPVSIGLIIASSAMTFLDPTLSLHLETFGVSTAVAGVLFLLIGGLYALTMPLWGYLADKKGRTRLMALIGFLLMGVSYMLVGPSPLLRLPNHLWIVIVSLSLTGISIGCACMPLFLDMMVSARLYGFADDMSTNGIVSGIFGGCFSLGSFIGPVLGGILKDSIGFNWASTYVAASLFAVALIIAAFTAWEFQCGKGRRKPWRYFGDQNPHEINSQSDTGIANGTVTRTVVAQVHINSDISPALDGYLDNSYPVHLENSSNGPWSDQLSDTQPLIVN